MTTVGAGYVFNCTELGTIKIGIIQHFPFAKIFDGTFETKPMEEDISFYIFGVNQF